MKNGIITIHTTMLVIMYSHTTLSDIIIASRTQYLPMLMKEKAIPSNCYDQTKMTIM